MRRGMTTWEGGGAGRREREVRMDARACGPGEDAVADGCGRGREAGEAPPFFCSAAQYRPEGAQRKKTRQHIPLVPHSGWGGGEGVRELKKESLHPLPSPQEVALTGKKRLRRKPVECTNKSKKTIAVASLLPSPLSSRPLTESEEGTPTSDRLVYKRWELVGGEEPGAQTYRRVGLSSEVPRVDSG